MSSSDTAANDSSLEASPAIETHPPKKKTKRQICETCQRPQERACICEALPKSPIVLKKCQVLVLQHPHEARRKNRSLPLVELCLNQSETCGSSPSESKQLHTFVARRLGEQVDSNIMRQLQDPDRDLVLVFPSKDAIPLEEALEELQRRRLTKTQPNSNVHIGKITVLVLDATWRFAREMEQANIATNQYPDHMIRVALHPQNEAHDGGSRDYEAKNTKKEKAEVFTAPPSVQSQTTHQVVLQREFQPCRFDIRTPPSADHLSTAECIAWVVSVIEDDASIYNNLMKPLDLMVKKWHSFSDTRNSKKPKS